MLVVDRGLCDVNGLCVEHAPDHLRIDEDEELEIIRAEVREDEREAVARAVASCPKAALKVLDAES
ncbi:hypothetical protein B2G71_04500 [Novosphingobium sp. PC22D]|uniref:ferredoxin n=1 Tax=Novosphingobium sp. PC22D TaxID=1962403 RepID=UPI000BF16E80|nr:ferredoxin [Novosphingobium sp. PC22D]PEQ13597.1 hypothetical protein B2G71_04500 [Novosphingobium sp. PC22D]